LTCGSWQEAQRIADRLLEQRLVACVEFMEIKSKYWWKQSLEEAAEVKLIMTTASHLFDEVEAEVKKLHSYERFVLAEISLTNVSAGVAEWLKNNTK
jgi:uncharacterized protein involved in tolerance to divalent cations